MHFSFRPLSLACLPLTLLSLASPAGAVSSAELYGLTDYRYGKFEARVQFPPGDGVVGSFFLWKTGSEMPDAYWNELDFEKVEEGCELHLNSIYGNPESNHTSEVVGATGLCSAYHHYAYEWTPDYIAWFVDGVEVRRDTGTDAQVYVDNAAAGMKFDFNIWPGTVAFGGNFSPDILPVHEYISFVQYSAYTPGAGDGGSDFSFAWRESFEAGFPTGWGRGTWESPLGQSTHAAANVNVVDGVLVLSLTNDDATGYTETPPADPMDLPSATGTDPGTGGASPMGGASGTGGEASGSGGSDGGELDELEEAPAEGCSCDVAGDPRPSPGSFGLLLAAMLVPFGVWLRRAAGRQ